MSKFSSWMLELSLLLIIMLLGAHLRLWNLETNPAWYTDESTHLEIASNILNGESRYFAIKESFLLFARLPLFEYSLALVFQLFGTSMLSLRSFTAALGIFSCLLLYLLIRDLTGNRYLSILAAFAYAIMPQALLYSRFGFSYNLLLPFVLLSLWAAVRYQHSGNWHWLSLISICIGLGTVSEFLTWSFLPLLFIIGKNWRDKVLSLILALLPLVFFATYQLLTIPEAFLFDLGYSLGRTGGGSIIQQISRIAENLTVLLSDAWWLAALVGLFLLKDAALRQACFLFLLPLFFLARTVPLYSLSAYYTLPFFPLLAIGLASFFYYGAQFARQRLEENFGTVLALALIGLLFVLPLASISFKESQKVRGFYPTAIDAFLINPQEALAVVDYIHSSSAPDDIILASAPVGALLDRPVVEFQMAVVALAQDAIHIPHDLAPERFAYSADYQQASYIVVDNLWRNWGAVHIPAIAEILHELESWDLVFETDSIQVYKNPAR